MDLRWSNSLPLPDGISRQSLRREEMNSWAIIFRMYSSG
jgi:hypothetical protein